MSFPIGYSATTYLALSTLHLLAACSVVVAGLPALLALPVLLALLRSAFVLARDYGKYSAHRPCYCSISNQAVLLWSEHDVLRCGPPRLIYLSEYLVLVEFETESATRHRLFRRKQRLILFADALARADFCRLQRFLRFELQGESTVSSGGSLRSG